MLRNNPFVLPANQYKRNIDFFGDYVRDNAFFLSRMTGDSIEECTQFVQTNMKPDGLFPVQDPRVLMLEATPHGDREQKVTTLGKYIYDSLKDDELISPTFTTFVQPSVKASFQPPFMRKNIALRKKFKHEMFEFGMKGDKVNEDLSNKKQNNTKTTNNSVSGTYTIPSTPMVNPTAHAVLTSTCRVTSGYGNANNEKMIAGNRHYWAPRIVMNNITSIVTHTDYVAFDAVMQKYQLVYPTVEQTMECIRRGAMKYFRDEVQYREIQDYLEKLKPVELAAFVYTGDIYHIRKFNDAFMREFMRKFTEVKLGLELEDPVKDLKDLHPDYYLMSMNIHKDSVAGVMVNQIKEKEDLMLRKVVGTALNSERVVEEYADFLEVMFRSTNMPASLAYFPSSVRHVALTSDTDSTIFTCQEWVEWYAYGDLNSPEGSAVGAAICNIASQTIIHLLAMMSANFGIKEDNIFLIAMKNEFNFDPFIPADVSKHYFAYRVIQEGNVFTKPKEEIKGVHMKASNAPIAINQASHDLMLYLMDAVRAGKEIDLVEVLTKIADSERQVMESIRSGSPEFCRYAKIKEVNSYRQGPSKSPYQYHLFWNEVFGPKYGMVEEPPYLVVKVNTDVLSSPNKIRTWLDTLEDKALAERFWNYCVKNGKKQVKTMYIPESIVETKGIPEEILSAADYRGIAKKIHITFYVILTTLGFYIEDDKVNRLVSDYY